MKKRIIFLVLIVILSVSFSGCNKKDKEALGEQEEAYIAVEIETLKPNDLYIENNLSAKVYADKDVYVMPKLVGKVEKVNVKIGDKVEKDDILFIIEKEDIEKQVNQAKTAYEAGKASYEMTVEQINTAKTSFERTKKLYEEGAISKTSYEQAELAASEKPLEAAKKGFEQAELAYNQALDALENVEVKAPIGGTVTSINIESGEYATNTQPSMTIMEMNNVAIEFGVAENIVNKIDKGDIVTIEIDAANYLEEAIIDSISESVDPMTGLYPVKINISNNGSIKPGMFANARINTDRLENVMAVRSEAVLEKNGKYIVFLAEENAAVEKEVTIGLDTGVYIEIKSGLKIDDKVIIKGQNYTNDGSKIKVIRGE